MLSETDGATLTRINNFCRASQPQKGFISCESWGASGYAFLDYGDEFTVFDQTGEECKQYLVSGITQENPGIVTVNDEKRHIFQDGDYVVFREV